LKGEERLLVVSNRVPPSTAFGGDGRNSAAPVGGLVSALRPAVEKRGGLWFGWSGRSTNRRPDLVPTVSDLGKVQLATVDLSEDDLSLYYTGFANRTLWPLLHSFPERVVIRHDTYRAYRRINRRFAAALYPLLRPGDLVWVHDYHLFHIGQELRQMGWEGKIGFFLHVPFPPADIFAILPWATQLLEGLLRYDLVGVHTDRYLSNLMDTLRTQLGGTVSDGMFSTREHSARFGAYEIGIDPAIFQPAAYDDTRESGIRLLLPPPPDHRMILGVDRLDYTKGIPERLTAFGRLLNRNPSLRGKVSFVQVSSPSRTRVPEYIQERERVNQLVGRINGSYSEGNWVPVRYLYRSVPQHDLARLYRDADVCMVTPLRDGMNLVAKEFVASQDNDPGVLVLSKFCGAADSMRDALIVNPYDVDGTAEATYTALRMPKAERHSRWAGLMRVVAGRTARDWSEAFTSDLARS
jgi:trehalose 6-phosphate synthase